MNDKMRAIDTGTPTTQHSRFAVNAFNVIKWKVFATVAAAAANATLTTPTRIITAWIACTQHYPLKMETKWFRKFNVAWQRVWYAEKCVYQKSMAPKPFISRTIYYFFVPVCTNSSVGRVHIANSQHSHECILNCTEFHSFALALDGVDGDGASSSSIVQCTRCTLKVGNDIRVATLLESTIHYLALSSSVVCQCDASRIY